MKVYSVDVAIALAKRLTEAEIEEFVIKSVECWAGMLKIWFLKSSRNDSLITGVCRSDLSPFSTNFC